MGKSAEKILRKQFLTWQCRIRQAAMREHGGRPAPGMRPRLLDGSGGELAPALTVLLLPKAPQESTDFFRFQAMKSADPRERYERALTYLQADYFQQPKAFTDTLLAVLPADSPLAAQLAEGTRCTLAFAENGVGYALPCEARALQPGDAAREAAIWHNRLFNPALPETVQVVAFQPDWASAVSEETPLPKAHSGCFEPS
ncbi:MAG: hypothetical protein ACREDO_02020 [Methyloceanibacter sp.]